MELRHIRYFLAIAEEGNFTRAAERVGIGQPPLSLQIRDLEREIGTRLFHRIPQGAELTAAGQAFHDVVRSLPGQVEYAIHSAQRAARGEIGALRVGFTASAAFNQVVATTIRNFRRGYPSVALSLEESNSTRLMQALRGEELDVVFLRPGAQEAGDCRFRLLSEEPIMAVLSTRHSLAGARRLKLSSLSEDPFILFPRAVGPVLFDTIIAACHAAGFEPKLGQTAPQISSIVNLVSAELGVSLVPASMQHIQPHGVVYKQLDDIEATADLSLAWRRTDNSPFLQNFIDCAMN